MSKRRRQIIQAAQDLFVEKGFTNTSIMDILAAANISKGTFYNHFNSKNECLIAILEETREESMTHRYKIGLNQDISNPEILIQEISILLQTNRKQNLIKIFESIYDINDIELKELLKTFLLKEICWLAKRLIDVFGQKIDRIAYECSSLLLGMIQHTLRTNFLLTKESLPPERVVKKALLYIEAIIPVMMDSNDLLITKESFDRLNDRLTFRTVTKEELITQLSGFVLHLNETDPENGIEYAQHLLKELQEPMLKLYILESILVSFNEAFVNTAHEQEAREITHSFWLFLKAERQ